ncbi:hypothetical protein ACKA0G_29085 [Priestia megaterium]|uniref:hypothetical protein n=1 Tax=Priestia megaterium TaxID=1404 RepID=UPI0038ABD523
MPINRLEVKGNGNGTANIGGWSYVAVTTNGPITIEYTYGGKLNVESIWAHNTRINIPSGVTTVNVKALPRINWRFNMQNSVPPINPSELNVSRSETGEVTISGDDDAMFLSQSVNLSTIDISDMRVEIDSLGKLFNKALATKSVTDAARYAKMKNAILTQTKI